MRTLTRNVPGERGAAFILFSLVLAAVVLPMVGLAIDGGIVYLANARLSSAADAAALAGGRSLSIGLDFAAQKKSAENTAIAYFNANFPPGLLNTTNVSVTALAAEASNHTRTVTVQASADVNLYFMTLIGHPTSTPVSAATSSRRDVNVMLVLDRSGSMVRVCDTMKADAELFVDKFTNGRDTLGLVTFMGSANTDYSSTNAFKINPTLNDTLGKLKCGGMTGSAAGLILAQAQIEKVAEPGAQNVIVFFTDGVPNGFTANFPVKGGKSCNAGKTILGFTADAGGLFDPTPVSISNTNEPLLSIAGCAFSKNSSKVGDEIDYIPDSDLYGNSATGYKPSSRPVAGDGKQHVKVDDSTDRNAASINAADFAAQAIRQKGTLIYTIGLDGNGGVDGVLLQRIANDPASPIYNSSQPTGQYHYSPNAGQLASAFNSIASEILRISN